MAASQDLRSAYGLCRRMQRRHDPTYYWATMRLPREVRPAVHALYGFVRGADELVDGPDRDASPAARRRALDAWQDELESGLARGESAHPVIAALVDAGQRHELPLGELSVYMESMRTDCGTVRLQTREELERYMRGSAGAVGLIMAPLLGAPIEAHAPLAQLGVAFQLANFIRDVREDYALDRVYLPAEEQVRFGVTERDIAGSRCTPALAALLADEVGRARELFALTATVTDAVHPRVRSGIRLARDAYTGMLDRVEAAGYDVLRRRARLSARQVGAIAWTALARGSA